MKFLILTLLATVSLNLSTASAANYIDTAGAQNSGGQIRPQEGTRGDCFDNDCTVGKKYYGYATTNNLVTKPYIVIVLVSAKNIFSLLVDGLVRAKPSSASNMHWTSSEARTMLLGNNNKYGEKGKIATQTTLDCRSQPALIIDFLEPQKNGSNLSSRSIFPIHSSTKEAYEPMSEEECIKSIRPKFDTWVQLSFDLDSKTNAVILLRNKK